MSRPSQFPSAFMPLQDLEPRELLPGDVALGLAGDPLKTLLGSCVCVILTDPRRTVGAMCHIVHVGEPNSANRKNTAYGSVAMEEMNRLLRTVGVAPEMCQAFVYGGGNMFPHLISKHAVGDTNVAWVMQHLASRGIAVLDRSVGGPYYRTVSWTVGPLQPEVKSVSVDQENVNAH